MRDIANAAKRRHDETGAPARGKGLHTMSEVPSGGRDSRASRSCPEGRESSPSGAPEGDAGKALDDGTAPDPSDVHAWYTRGLELLGKGSPAAAAQVLQRAAQAAPESRSVREALARAQFDTGQYAEAASNFRAIIEASPAEDYAYFGLGLSLSRTGQHAAAVEYLALAAAMRPVKHYTEALRQVRATLEARKRAANGG
ncbi:MAG: repeat-containing protein [Actinomycetia bacterium]|nr:repeat-containing protein [Actinomycetes bacterium]